MWYFNITLEFRFWVIWFTCIGFIIICVFYLNVCSVQDFDQNECSNYHNHGWLLVIYRKWCIVGIFFLNSFSNYWKKKQRKISKKLQPRSRMHRLVLLYVYYSSRIFLYFVFDEYKIFHKILSMDKKNFTGKSQNFF